MSSFNGLTEAQEERLHLLIEECSEVIKCSTKILRFGYYSINPYAPQDGTNLDQLHLEMGDYDSIKRLLVSNHDISDHPIQMRTDSKYLKLQQYLRNNHVF